MFGHVVGLFGTVGSTRRGFMRKFGASAPVVIACCEWGVTSPDPPRFDSTKIASGKDSVGSPIQFGRQHFL